MVCGYSVWNHLSLSCTVYCQCNVQWKTVMWRSQLWNTYFFFFFEWVFCIFFLFFLVHTREKEVVYHKLPLRHRRRKKIAEEECKPGSFESMVRTRTEDKKRKKNIANRRCKKMEKQRYVSRSLGVVTWRTDGWIEDRKTRDEEKENWYTKWKIRIDRRVWKRLKKRGGDGEGEEEQWKRE